MGSVSGMTTSETHNGTTCVQEHSPRLDWALIKNGASQLNHCAFCLDMHTKDALTAGESAERIIQLNAWAESKHFDTAKDIAAIAAITAITAITASNRFGVSTRMAPGHYTPGA
jgi:AhpD family alkylhydroperoxidase